MTIGDRPLFIRAFPRTAALLVLIAAISACETAPEKPADPAPPVATASPPPEQQPLETPPMEPEEIACPEPEPMPDPVCPPPPKPKPCPVCPQAKVEGKMLVGAVEKVQLSPPGVTYTARIDSGAEGSSIHAVNIVRFERDGERWVRFELDQSEGAPVVMERKVERRVLVRQASVDEVERRVKILMNVTLGTYSDLVEFSLNDRSEMEYPVLIGRNVLRNNAIVDVSQEFIAK